MSLETFCNLPEHKQRTIIDKGIEVFSKYSFTDASTDVITQEAEISKGLLFHYFGSKKAFYLYLLDYSLKLLSQFELSSIQENANDFYKILFDSMNTKFELISKYPKEMLFTNFAAKETSKQVVKEKQELINQYMILVNSNSVKVLTRAINALNLRSDINKEKLVKGLSIYVNAIITQYLHMYKDNPQDFFAKFDLIQSEIKDYMSLMLQGVEVKNYD